MRYDGSNAQQVRELIPHAHISGPVGVGEQILIDGELVSSGAWIARNKNGHYRVLSEDEFLAEYEPA